MTPPHQNTQAQAADLKASGTPARDAWATVRDLLGYLWPRGRNDLKVRLVVALVLVLIGKVVIVYAPFFYKRAVDGLTAEGGREAALIAVPVFLIMGYAFARMMGLVMAQARHAIFAKVGEALRRRLARMVFEHLHALSVRFHYDRRTGGLARVVDRGVSYADFLLNIALFNILPTLIELALVVIVLTAAFGYSYALVTGLTVIAYVGFTFKITEWRRKIRRHMNDTDADVSSKAVDSLLNFETVKYFTNEAHEAERYDEARAVLEVASERTTVTMAYLNGGQVVIFSLGLAALLVMAGFEVAAGTMSIGAFVMVNTYLIQLAGPLDSMGTVYRLVKDALVDTERMLELLREDPDVTDVPDASGLHVRTGAVHFENVSFGYTDERQILHGVSFEIPAGRTVAVVGPTGAGKSTLSRLLFRFFDVDRGRITVDRQDIAGVRQSSLRSAIGIVPQDTVLFNDTIGYNIAYGRPGASQTEIEAAARDAQLHDFIASLPRGYETAVGERGLKLSGGEKQRVAIARTLLKDPPILVLDEATSALDTHTERHIQAALRNAARGRTTLVIAHRLSTVMDADEIIVLEEGRVVERGTHQELLGTGGLYASMWARQKDIAEAQKVLEGELEEV